MNRLKLVKLNRHNLDEEAEVQAERYLEAADRMADIGKEKDDLEKDLSELEADLARKYRKNPKKYLSSDKATDKAVAEKLTINEKVKELRGRVIDVKHRFNKAGNLVRSLDQRRSSMKYLAELWMGGYWSDLNVSGSDESDIILRKKKRSKTLKKLIGDDDE